MNRIFAGFTGYMRRSWLAAALLTMLPGHVFAGQTGNSKESHSSGQGYITAGIAGGPTALNSYQAIIYAPFGSLSDTGLILRAWNKAFRFSYKTDLPTANDVTINALGLSVEGEVGWQYAGEHGRVALYGGIVWRDHFLTPNDPGANLSKSRFGVSVTLDGEYKIAPDYGIMANASFLQGYNQYWTQIKPYMMVGDGRKIGLDLASAGGKSYNITQIGLFASDFEYSFWPGKRMFWGARAGVRLSLKKAKPAPYAGINMGYLF